MSNAFNEYRLVFKRYDYDYVEINPDSDGPVALREERSTIRTYTEWMPFDGKEVLTKEANAIEFRYNEEAK